MVFGFVEVPPPVAYVVVPEPTSKTFIQPHSFEGLEEQENSLADQRLFGPRRCGQSTTLPDSAFDYIHMNSHRIGTMKPVFLDGNEPLVVEPSAGEFSPILQRTNRGNTLLQKRWRADMFVISYYEGALLYTHVSTSCIILGEVLALSTSANSLPSQLRRYVSAEINNQAAGRIAQRLLNGDIALNQVR